MKSGRVSLSICALLISILACNLPGGGPTETPTPTPENDLAATITAQAALLAAPPVTPGLPTETPTITPTTAPSVPMVSVNTATNCRTGNSAAFDWVYALDPGTEAEVVGKNTDTGYWIIKYPGGQCWLWGQYATVTGDASGIPEIDAPAPPVTDTPSVPAAPTNFNVDFECTSPPAGFQSDVHVEMTWTDVATNEEGYKVFRDGELLATLGPNATSHTDDTTQTSIKAASDPIPYIEYAVRAFNSDGASPKKTKSITCWSE
jgi:hypothetical protein